MGDFLGFLTGLQEIFEWFEPTIALSLRLFQILARQQLQLDQLFFPIGVLSGGDQAFKFRIEQPLELVVQLGDLFFER